MKKLVSLLCCICLIHVLQATPRKFISQPNAPATEQLRQAVKQFGDGRCKSLAPGDNIIDPGTSGQEIRLTFDKFAKGPKYYSSGDWYVELINDDDWEVYLNWEAPKTNYCGTFGTNDFLHDYSYIFTPDNRQNGGIHYKNITMTISIVEVNPALDSIVLDATILGTDGNTYIIHASQEVIKAKEVVTQSILDATLVEDYGSYTIAGKNDDLDISVVVMNDRITGIYPTIEDFDMTNSHIIYKGKQVTPLRMEAIVDLGNLETGDLAYGAQFTILSTDTAIYNIFLAAPFPEPTDTVSIACQNMRFDDSFASVYNIMTVSASNDDYKIQIMYSDDVIAEGDFTEANATIYITDVESNEEVESLVATMQIRYDAVSDSYAIEATARCSNNVVYQLSLTWVVPTTSETVDVTFVQTAQASYYAQDNDLLLMNENDEYSLSLNIVGVDMGDTFTMDDVEEYYTSLYDKQHNQSIDIAQIDGRIYQSGDTTWINANMVAFDAKCYQVAMWYAAPTPTDTITLHLTDVPFTNQLEEGYFQLIGYTEDYTTMISFTVASHQVEGTFVNDGMFGKFGEGQYDFFNDYTYISEWNSATREYEIYTVEKGELVVSMDSDGKIEAQANVICENAKLYQINIASEYSAPNLLGDAIEGDVERTYSSQDHIQITDYTKTNSLIIFEAESEVESDMMVLYFFSNTFDNQIGIPEGEYPINSSLLPGTVLASTGIDEEHNAVTPSLYSTFDGEYLDRMYFFVDGSVNISKNDAGKLHLEVNAVNSYLVPIHIVYDAGGTTDVEDIHKGNNTNTQKMLLNGQLLILRNGIRYDVVGRNMKK